MNVQTSFTNFEYEQGSGPSNSQSFAINYEGLTDAIQINTIAPVSAMEFSLDSIGWSASIDTTNTYSGTGTLTAYTRLKSGLSSSLYNGQFYVSFPQDGDDIPVNYNAAVKVPQQNVTIAGFYQPLRTFFGYPSASQYVSNPQEIVVNVKNPTFASMSIVVTSSYQLCTDRDPFAPVFFTSSVSQSIITASGITNDYSLRFWMRLRSGSAGSVDTTLTVRDENNNTLVTASIAGRRYTGLSAIDCWNEATNIDVLWRNIGTNANTAYQFGKHRMFDLPSPGSYFDTYIKNGFITDEDYNYYYRREVTGQQNLHVRVVTPITTFLLKSLSTSSNDLFPDFTATSFYLNSTTVPTSPEFVTIRFQVLEPELLQILYINSTLTGVVNSPVSITGLNQFKYTTSYQFRGSQLTTADIQSTKFVSGMFGSVTPSDTNGFLDSFKLPSRVGGLRINATRGGKKNPYYYPNVYAKTDTFSQVQLNNVYEERNFRENRTVDNIPQDGFLNADTVQITATGIPLPEISDLSIYPNLQNLTLANLTGSLTTLYLPQNLTTLTISGSPVSYSINQEVPYSGALSTLTLFQSGSTNITNYDAFITNLRFTTSSQFIMSGSPTSSLPAIPSTVTSSIVGGGPFDEMNIRTFYTPGEPTMSILNVNGTGMTYTPNISMSFDTSVSDLKTVNITNLTASYDIDLSNLVSASINVVSGARNITLPITYANDNQTIRIDSRNLENVYVPINANYSGGRNTTLGLIPGFAIDTLDLTGSFVTNLTVSSSDYFNSFRRLLGGFETIRNYNFQFSSFDAGGVEYFLSQVSASGVKDFATSGSTTGSIVDNTKNWIPNQYTGSRIRVFDNTGNSYNDVITSNTTSSANFGRTVAGGNGTNTLAYSNDGGLNWIGLGSTIFSATTAVAWNGLRWVAGGSGVANSLAYSSDGITWVGLGRTIFDSSCDGIAWNGTLFVAVGQGSANTIAYSIDGINWTGLGTSIFDSRGRAVAWNGTRFIAAGGSTNTLAYSDDGINWTGLGASTFAIEGRAVAWTGTRFVAGGQNTSPFPSTINNIAYSSDGITWTNVPGTIVFTAFCSGLAWNGTRLVATGGGTTSLAYSDDSGSTWTSLGAGAVFDNSGAAVAWNGTRFIAGGNGTNNTLAYSSNGITWVGLGTSLFNSSCNVIASTTPFVSLTPNIGIAPSSGSMYAIIPDKTIDLRNQRNGLYITPAISSSKATLEGLGWTVNL